MEISGGFAMQKMSFFFESFVADSHSFPRIVIAYNDLLFPEAGKAWGKKTGWEHTC